MFPQYLSFVARLAWWLGVPGRWLFQLLRFITFVTALLPGLVPMFCRFVCSPRVLKGVRYGAGPRQYIDVYLPVGHTPPPSGFPCVAFVTGGAWIIGHRTWAFLMGHVAQRSGVLFFSVDYRNFPQAQVPAMVDDVEAALIWLGAEGAARYGGDPSDLTLVGQSAGAHLSALLLLRQVLKLTHEPDGLRATAPPLPPMEVAPVAESPRPRPRLSGPEPISVGSAGQREGRPSPIAAARAPGLQRRLWRTLAWPHGVPWGALVWLASALRAAAASLVPLLSRHRRRGTAAAPSRTDYAPLSSADPPPPTSPLPRWRPRRFVRRWVGISGPYDIPQLVPELQERGLPDRLLQALMAHDLHAVSPVSLAAQLSGPAAALLPPMVLFHGTADRTAKSEHCVTLAAALRARGVDISEVYFDGATHTAPILEGPLSGSDPLMGALLALLRVGPLPASGAPIEPGGGAAADHTLDASGLPVAQLPHLVPQWMLACAAWANPF